MYFATSATSVAPRWLRETLSTKNLHIADGSADLTTTDTPVTNATPQRMFASPHRRFLPATLAVIGLLLLAGCSSDSLAEQYRAGSGKNYIAGDGAVTEIGMESRGEPIVFSGVLEDGSTVAPDTYAGKVTVVNFWYAGCAPCRAEAPDLQALNEEFSDQDVAFLGVNVRDQTATATAFASQFGISYPSIIDVNSGETQLAFSGSVAPNAVPTTVVLDREGRVASRILGRLADQSILRTLVNDTLAEEE